MRAAVRDRGRNAGTDPGDWAVPMMRNALSGIGGNLFAGRYLVETLSRDLPHIDSGELRRKSTQLGKWWTRTTETCGPAVAVRTIFDRVAMPLFGGLGFRAIDARFDVGSAHVAL